MTPASAVTSCGILEELWRVVKSRDEERPTSSYTVKLLEAGLPYIARKVGEEAVEVVVAALSESSDRLVAEAADLLYHLTVLLYARGVEWRRVFEELEARRRGRQGGEAEDRRDRPG